MLCKRDKGTGRVRRTHVDGGNRANRSAKGSADGGIGAGEGSGEGAGEGGATGVKVLRVAALAALLQRGYL